MADAPHRRRWYQFRLSTLMLVVTAAALVAVAYRTYVEPYTQQRQTQRLIEQLGGTYQSSDPRPWQRRLFGADHQNLVVVNLADCPDPEQYVAHIARLPVLETLVVGGEAFGDQQLRPLSGLSTLRVLVLDSTSVSSEALDAWRQRLPNVTVYHSQRRAMRWLTSSGWTIAVQKANVAGPSANGVSPDFFLKADLAIGRKVEDAALAPLRCLTTLRTVSLADTSVTDAGLLHLRDLPDLDYLDLTGTAVTDAALEQLAPLTNLVYLDLAGTHITDAGLEHLMALPKLGWLNLSRTQLSDAGLPTLARLKSLRMLYVHKTKVSQAAAQELDRSLRPCMVLGP